MSDNDGLTIKYVCSEKHLLVLSDSPFIRPPLEEFVAEIALLRCRYVFLKEDVV
jgi:hypothetical protein